LVRPEDILLFLWDDQPGGGIPVSTALGGTFGIVATVPSPYEFHEFSLACVGQSYTISVDGDVVYGPVTSALRPKSVNMGNPSIAFWYPTDWGSFSVDYIRVEGPGNEVGACCFPNGACLQGSQTDCQSLGGVYMGDGVSCDPDPCQATPVRTATWGMIRSAYR
jgi:hypothetical protein